MLKLVMETEGPKTRVLNRLKTLPWPATQREQILTAVEERFNRVAIELLLSMASDEGAAFLKRTLDENGDIEAATTLVAAKTEGFPQALEAALEAEAEAILADSGSRATP